MRKYTLGAFALAAVVGSAIISAPQAQASKPFTPVTKLQCEKCHTEKDKLKMSEKDLNDSGKKSFEILKKGGYPHPKDAKTQREWAEKLLKDFKG